jgi:hypothetical protein
MQTYASVIGRRSSAQLSPARRRTHAVQWFSILRLVPRPALGQRSSSPAAAAAAQRRTNNSLRTLPSSHVPCPRFERQQRGEGRDRLQHRLQSAVGTVGRTAHPRIWFAWTTLTLSARVPEQSPRSCDNSNEAPPPPFRPLRNVDAAESCGVHWELLHSGIVPSLKERHHQSVMDDGAAGSNLSWMVGVGG